MIATISVTPAAVSESLQKVVCFYIDLRYIVRAHPTDDAILRQAIIDSMQLKPEGHDFNLEEQPIIMRHMSSTGG